MKLAAFLIVCISLTACTFMEPGESANSCVAPLRGKVISTHPSCAGVVVQVTTESFPDSVVQATYTDSYGNTFSSVFLLANICEMAEDEEQWLLDASNIGIEFKFYLLPPAIDDLCGYCKPLVALPEKSQRIYLSDGQCNDVIVIGD